MKDKLRNNYTVITNLIDFSMPNRESLEKIVGIAFAEMYKFNQENPEEKDIKNNNLT